jgi:hypothetical protein
MQVVDRAIGAMRGLGDNSYELPLVTAGTSDDTVRVLFRFEAHCYVRHMDLHTAGR